MFGSDVFTKFSSCYLAVYSLNYTWGQIRNIKNNDQSGRPSLHDALFLLNAAEAYGVEKMKCFNDIVTLDTSPQKELLILDGSKRPNK